MIKGFIEVTARDDNYKYLISIDTIASVSRNAIIFKNNVSEYSAIFLKESYEEIKQKIKDAVEINDTIDDFPLHYGKSIYYGKGKRKNKRACVIHKKTDEYTKYFVKAIERYRDDT